MLDLLTAEKTKFIFTRFYVVTAATRNIAVF
jgi:hypothetical protein